MKLHHELVGEGEPLFLLNGIMMTTATWAQTTRALAPHFRCVLHDFRGQLRSDKPPGPYAMSMHVDDLAALMDELGIESAHLVGTSYGGEVGLLFAAAHPDRVRSLSVIASVARADAAMAEGARRWADLVRRHPERLWDAVLPLFYSPQFIAANPAFIEAGRQRVAALPAEWFRAFADLCDAFAGLDADLAAIRCPTLVVCGADDTLKPPRCSREIADGIAGAELVTIENAGHAVVVEKPDELNEALLRFLLRPALPTAHRS